MRTLTAGNLTAKFNREQSWFPVEGQPNDLFNHNFKLVVDIKASARGTIPAKTFFIGILWKGRIHPIGINTQPLNVPVQIPVSWTHPPTIAQLLSAFGEKVPSETKSYSYAWVTGFIVNSRDYLDPNGGHAAVTDQWNTNLLVIIKGWPVNKILAAAGVGAIVLGALALASSSSARQYAYQYGLATKQYLQERVVPAAARAGARAAYAVGSRLEQYGQYGYG